MEKFTFINSNEESINFSEDYPYILQTFEGIGGVKTAIQKQKSINQDGESYLDNYLEPRYITLQITLVAKNTAEMSSIRSRLLKVLNPKLGLGILRYEVGNNIKELKALAEFAPDFFPEEEFRDTRQKAFLSLYCPNPYWQDISISSEEMVTWIGGMTFPLSLPTEFAMAGEKIINIINSGDVETPITLEISGTATNPKVMNTLTGEYIKVNRTLDVGDTLIITTEFANKRVEQNGINVFNYIDLGSTFFSLNAGDNILELTTDDINDNATIKISYRNRYLGV